MILRHTKEIPRRPRPCQSRIEPPRMLFGALPLNAQMDLGDRRLDLGAWVGYAVGLAAMTLHLVASGWS